MITPSFKVLAVAAIVASIGTLAGTVPTPPKNDECKPYTTDKMYIGQDEAKFTGVPTSLHLETFNKNKNGKVDSFYTGGDYKYFINLYPADKDKKAYTSFYTQVYGAFGSGLHYVYTVEPLPGKGDKIVLHVENEHRCDLARYFDPKDIKSVNVQEIIKKAGTASHP